MLENGIDLVKIYFWYCVLILAIPSILAKAIVPKSNKIKRFFMAIVLGNTIAINLVYFLVFLKQYTKLTFISSYLIVCLIIYVFLNHKKLNKQMAKFHECIEIYEAGAIKLKQIYEQVKEIIIRKIKSMHVTWTSCLEFLIVFITLLWIVYILSRRVITLESFVAPDEEVHLQWIQSLLKNDIFHSGIYPYGIHTVVSAISLISNIFVAKVLKYFGIVSATISFIIVYLSIRSITKNKVALLLVFSIIFTSNLFNSIALSRFQYPIPHEYGLQFFMIMAISLLWYLKDGKWQDIFLFTLSLMNCMFIHFHTVIVAAIFCLCAGIVYLIPIFKTGKFKILMLGGITALLVGSWPIGVGLSQGKEFEQSMNWAVSVIQGKDNLKDKIEKDEEEKEEKEEDRKETFPFFSLEMYDYFTKFSYSKPVYGIFIVGTVSLGFILFIFRKWRKKDTNKEGERWVLYIFSFIILFMMISGKLGLPVLLYPTRLVIYQFFLMEFILSSPFEELYRMSEAYKNVQKTTLYVSGIFFLSVQSWIILKNQMTTFPEFYYFQTTGSNRATTHICETYEDDTWTIVSTVTETAMVSGNGYHYEWIDLLQNIEKGKDVVIPTKYVFFIIEKKPIYKFGHPFVFSNKELMERPAVQMEDAYKEFKPEKFEEDFYKKQRNVVMAKAKLFVDTLKTQYPLEMDVYYEDEEVEVYRLKQNENYNNLSIEYIK